VWVPVVVVVMVVVVVVVAGSRLVDQKTDVSREPFGGLKDRGYFIPYCHKIYVAKWLSGMHAVVLAAKVLGSNPGGNN
jgi:hypothetical protein